MRDRDGYRLRLDGVQAGQDPSVAWWAFELNAPHVDPEPVRVPYPASHLDDAQGQGAQAVAVVLFSKLHHATHAEG